jgi:hypothetical protein
MPAWTEWVVCEVPDDRMIVAGEVAKMSTKKLFLGC